jgi:predicted O-methyltransferase YrrM
MAYEFKHEDWWQHAQPVLETLRDRCLGRCERIVEVGAFEGRSTVWLLEHMLAPGGTLFSIDTWQGGVEHAGFDMAEVEARWERNAKSAGGDVRKIKSDSRSALRKLGVQATGWVDCVYIDGSHAACDVLFDSVLAWDLLRVGGAIVWDDYLWDPPKEYGLLGKPRLAIDSFCNVMDGSYQLLHSNYMRVVQKRG